MFGINSIELRAYAKINLSLEVTGKRADGYHDIMSLMQGIDLCDVIKITKCAENGTKYNLPHCTIDGVVVYLCTDAETIPADMSNLALKGVKAVLDRYIAQHAADDLPRGLVVSIEKKLPVAAGIAGGSGNGAVCMLGMDAMLGYPFSLRELMEIGAGVGADIPFSLMMNARRNASLLAGLPGLDEAGTAAWVSGIGEIVEPTEPMVRHIVMVNPGISVSTRDAYIAIDDLNGFTGSEVSANGPERRLFVNDFEAYTFAGYPEAAGLADAMRENLDADVILMSGSGPTMIAYYTDADKASADYIKMLDMAQHETGWRVWETVTGLK